MNHLDPPATLGTGAFLFAIYAWLAFILSVLVGIVFALLLPGLERRRRWVSASARASFLLTGMSVKVRGLEKLPQGHCIVVANHASYIDGVVLFGYLPPRFAFVIKGEMQRLPLAGFMLRRIGAKFVERFEASGSARDARNLLKAASSGESLAFFPEGTFLPHPGLDRFRAGAFLAAVKGNMSVVPIAISGTRHMLPSERHLPRFGRIQVDILSPISIDDPSFSNHRALAELARQRILAVLDEPDLVGEQANSPGALI